MSWTNVLKFNSSRFGGGMEGHAFETTDIPFNNYDSENNGWPEDGECIVKWEFSYGVREHGIREFGFFVTEIILQSNDNDDITITSSDDFEAEWLVQIQDKIWPSQVGIHAKKNDMADIDVM